MFLYCTCMKNTIYCVLCRPLLSTISRDFCSKHSLTTSVMKANILYSTKAFFFISHQAKCVDISNAIFKLIFQNTEMSDNKNYTSINWKHYSHNSNLYREINLNSNVRQWDSNCHTKTFSSDVEYKQNSLTHDTHKGRAKLWGITQFCHNQPHHQ